MTRILVIANETVEDSALRRAIRSRVGGDRAEVLVIAPALNSRLRHWVSDEGEARAAAASRVRGCLDRLAAAGIRARGLVGDSDPLQAIADGLRLFSADALVISTHPEQRSHWLARDLAGRARARFSLPIVHVVAGDQDEVLSRAAGF